MLTSLDHVQIAMPEGKEDEARRFYGDLLGLAEMKKPEPLASRGGCWFGEGAIQVHLGVQHDFQPATKAHAAFTVRDLGELRERLVSAGYVVVLDTPIPGVERFHTLDPFGNRLEFIQDGQGFSQRRSSCCDPNDSDAETR